MKRFRDTKYLVGENGEVYSEHVERNVVGNVGSNGYHYIVLKIEGRKVRTSIHRMVAEVYLGNENLKLHVNHKDGNKLNNNVSNLQWVTRSENTQHAYDTKLMTGPIGHNHKVGIKHHGAIVNDQKVLEIRKLYDERLLNNSEIAVKYGITPSNVSYIGRRKTWKHVKEA